MNPVETLVHVCRHGEVFNPAGVLYTRLPGYHLSQRGQAMAARLGEYFADTPLTALRCSPLERAQETMAPIAAGHPDLQVGIDARLLEADSHLAGMTGAQRRHPGAWRWYLDPLRPSWGEPYDQMAARMLAAIADAAAIAGPGAQACIVTHQCPIWVARLAVEHRPLAHLPFQRHCTLASVTTFAVDDAGALRFAAYEEPARDLLPRR